MMYKISSETYAHQCAKADSYIAEYRKKMALITIHDGCARLDLAVPTNSGITTYRGREYITEYIEYCPMCGVKLDEDTTTEEWLPARYNPWKEA